MTAISLVQVVLFCVLSFFFSLACLYRLHPGLSYKSRILFKYQLLFECYGDLFTPSWVYLHNNGWWNHALICIFLTCVYLFKIWCNFWKKMIKYLLKSESGSPVRMLSCLQSHLVVSYGFTARDRTVFHAICCVWPLRWWSAGRLTPGRICSKSSLSVMGGPEPGNMLGGLISPLLKGQIQQA